MDASGTIRAPSGKAPSRRRAASQASRVLPEPPAPTIVSSRQVGRSAVSSASSRSRPTNVVCVSQLEAFTIGGPLPTPAWTRGRGSTTSTAAEKR
jgi:hypothetical protein